MKIALVENFGADFVSARLRYALFLKNKGYEVYAIVPKDGSADEIKRQGIHVIEVKSNIRRAGIKTLLIYAFQLIVILRKHKFDITHFYRLQPNLVGTFIAGLFTNAIIVNHVTGLGIAFSSNTPKNRVRQFIMKFGYRLNALLFKPHMIFQNEQDILDLGIKKRVHCIYGSAVNEDKFIEVGINRIKTIPIQFLFVSRLLKEKGVVELINAFKDLSIELKSKVSLKIVGWSDGENTSAIQENALLEMIHNVENIEFLGKRTDVEKILAKADVAILPTYYREGTPRFMLEAMCMAKPIIVTNVPGGNYLVTNENGILIAPKSKEAIQKAIEEIVEADLLKMGANSKALYFQLFSEKCVYNQILELYISILN